MVSAVCGVQADDDLTMTPLSDAVALRLDSFEHHGRVFDFLRQIVVTRTTRRGCVVYEVPELGIVSADVDETKAAQGMALEFAALWDGLAMTDDADLTGDAIDLKRALLSLVARVHPVA
jgi:hypothetical protein